MGIASWLYSYKQNSGACLQTDKWSERTPARLSNTATDENVSGRLNKLTLSPCYNSARVCQVHYEGSKKLHVANATQGKESGCIIWLLLWKQKVIWQGEWEYVLKRKKVKKMGMISFKPSEGIEACVS